MPIPTFPFAKMRKSDVVAEPFAFVEEATSKSAVWSPFVFMMESLAQGVVVPRTVFTLYAPRPPKTREFETPACAFAPIVIAFVRLLGVTGPVSVPFVSS